VSWAAEIEMARFVTTARSNYLTCCATGNALTAFITEDK